MKWSIVYKLIFKHKAIKNVFTKIFQIFINNKIMFIIYVAALDKYICKLLLNKKPKLNGKLHRHVILMLPV